MDESCPPPADMGGVGALSRGHSMAELATRRAASFIAVPGVPLISPGDDLGIILIDNLESVGLPLHNDDVLVIAQKVVSKSEGRYVDLAAVVPSRRARSRCSVFVERTKPSSSQRSAVVKKITVASGIPLMLP